MAAAEGSLAEGSPALGGSLGAAVGTLAAAAAAGQVVGIPSWGSLPAGSLLCFGAGGSPEAGSQSLGLVHTDPAPLEEG